MYNQTLKTVKYFVIIFNSLLIMAYVFPCFGQTMESHQWHDSLNTAQKVAYLTKEEKAVIFEMNKVRSNPKAYVQYIKDWQRYSRGRISQQDLAVSDECIAELEKTEPMAILYPQKELTQAAKLLATDQAKTGKIGHTGSDGSTLEQRIARYLHSEWEWIGENLMYGTQDARTIVVELLVDYSIPSRGHRRNILSRTFDRCGVAFDTHPEYRTMCVMDFAKIRQQ
jgi:uncharacterized protein YkwD